jgi:DNA-nicking Smr family endonuclease
MAKKNRPPKCSDNPFSSLRGFPVSSPPPAPPPAPKTKPAESPESEDLFALEMSRLGVKGAGPKKPPAPKQEDGVGQAPVDDFALFIDALGEMKTVFAEEDALEKADSAAGSPLVREAQRGRVVPEEVLDLHGYSRVEALAKVAWFVDNALHHGCHYLLIITGRGRQSGEAVLREAVEGWLRSVQNSGVREWCRAPVRLGGEGALLLELKKKR